MLDLGSGGGIDVLLSAKRVGPTGFAYGVDMTTEMLDLARANAAQAGATNVEFLQGTIEDVPLPDGAVDVVISNCVINLSASTSRRCSPRCSGCSRRAAGSGSPTWSPRTTSPPAERAERGSYVGCIAGALSRVEYLERLAAVGFVEAVGTVHPAVADGMHNAIVQAIKPGGSPSRPVSAREHRGPDLDSCPARAGGLLRPCDQHGLLLDRRQGLLLRNYGRRAGQLRLPMTETSGQARPARFAGRPTHLRLAQDGRPAPPGWAARVLAEAMGTGMLVAAVIGSGIAAERLSPDDTGLQLLENAIATGAALTVLIVVLQPVSAAFNPVDHRARTPGGLIAPPGRPPRPSRRRCSAVPSAPCWPT